MCLQTLYESSIAFGMRKALQTEQGKGDMEGRIGTLEAETKDFERQVHQERSQYSAVMSKTSAVKAALCQAALCQAEDLTSEAVCNEVHCIAMKCIACFQSALTFALYQSWL